MFSSETSVFLAWITSVVHDGFSELPHWDVNSCETRFFFFSPPSPACSVANENSDWLLLRQKKIRVFTTTTVYWAVEQTWLGAWRSCSSRAVQRSASPQCSWPLCLLDCDKGDTHGFVLLIFRLQRFAHSDAQIEFIDAVLLLLSVRFNFRTV